MDEILRVLAPGAPLIIGLNAKFYREGTLAGKLSALSAAGRIDRLAEEHGEHITSAGMTGWVIAVRKASDNIGAKLCTNQGRISHGRPGAERPLPGHCLSGAHDRRNPRPVRSVGRKPTTPN